MPPSACFRVATLNILHDPPELSWSKRALLVMAGFRALDADIVLLQEVAWPNEQASALAAALSASAASHFTALVMPLITPHGWQESLALLTRYPVLDHAALRYPGAEQFCQRVRVDLGTHAIDIYNTHLDPYSAGRRRAQIMAILRWMHAYPGADGIVLGGDLNAAPETEELRPIRASLHSAHVTAHGREPAGTSNSSWGCGDATPVRTVDYLWHSPALAVLACQVIFSQPDPRDPCLFASDHVGLAAHLCLTDEGQLRPTVHDP